MAGEIKRQDAFSGEKHEPHLQIQTGFNYVPRDFSNA